MAASHEIATLYVSIVPETSKIAPGLKKEFNQIEKSGKSVGSRLGDVIGTGVKRAAQGAGLAAGALLGTALTKGMGRLSAIDTAEAKLSGLGHSASSVAGIMDDALASVKGTAFGLGEAGAAAASAVASGVKPGKDLQRTLKLMGDAAAIAGTDLNSMASIFNKVAASGKLQGDVLAQLGDAGIPIVQLLSEELGVAADQVYKLAADGKIGFAELQNAIETGMGGAALAVGDTFVGSMDNAGAALSRLGAEAMKPFFGGAITGVKTFTTVVDGLTSKVGPLAQELYDRLAPAAKTAGDFVEDRLVPGIRTVGEYAAAGMPTIQNFASSLTSMIGPAMTIGEALMDVAASLGISSWEALLTVLDITAGLMTSVVVPGLNVVADVLDSSSIAAFAFGTALVGLTKGKAVLDGLQRAGAWMEKRAGTMADFGRAAKETSTQMQSFSRAHPEVTRLGVATKVLGDNGQTGFAKITSGADSARQRVTAFGDAHRLAAAQAKAQALASTDAFTAIDRMGAQAWHGTVAAASTATQGIATSLGGLKGAGEAAFGGLKAGASGLMSMLGGPFGVAMVGAGLAVGAITSAYGDAKQAAKDLAAASVTTAEAQKELAREVAGTTGEIGEAGLAAATKLAESSMVEYISTGERMGTMFGDIGMTAKGFFSMSRDEWDAHKRSLREVEMGYDALTDYMDEHNMAMEQVNRIVAEGGTAYTALIQGLRDSGESGQMAAAELEKVREKVQRLTDEARRVSPASAEMSAAIEDIANKAGTAESRVDNFWRAVQKLRGQAPDMAEAGAALGNEIDSLANKLTVAEGDVSEFAGAVLNANGSIDTMAGASSRAAWDAVDGLARVMRDAVVSGHDAQAIYDQVRPSLDALGASANWSAEDVDRLAYAMQMTPEQLQILAKVESNAALGDIIHLQEKIDAMGTGLISKEITIEGGDDAIEKLREIGVEFTIINGEKGQIRIDAVDDDARRKIAGVIEEAGKLDARPPSRVSVESDVEGAKAGIDGVNVDLDMLDDRGATPTAGLNRTEFDGAIVGADGALTYLDSRFAVAGAGLDTAALDVNAGLSHVTLDGVAGRRPTPLSDLDNALLDGNANTAHGVLNVLDGQRPKPIADLNTDGVRAGVDRATEWIRNFIREFANTVVNMSVNVAGFVRTVFSGGDGAANGGTIGALARGGSIDLVRGGSLPTSGPGTNVTDGFLGVDRGGMPIVRVDAGEEVINRKQAVKHRRLLKAINRGDPRIDKLPAFETGGSIGSREGLDRALREAQSSHDAGATYVWGGHGRTGSDCSGFVSRVAWTAQGVDPDSVGRMGNTDTMMAGQWPGFRRGKFGPFIVGVNSAHMAATIDGIPVESGGDVGGPSVGEGDGANDPQFTEHWSMDHNAFSPPYSNAPAEATGVIYDGGTPTSPSVSGGNDRVVPLEDGTAQKVEKASQDENSIFYGTGSDSWSDLGGNIAKTAVSGQLSSLLKVLGIPDEMPPLVQAGKTWMQKVKDNASAQDIEKGDEAVAEQAEKELDAVEPFDRGGIAQGKGVLKKDITEPERVLDPSQTRAFDELVAEITKSGVSSAVSAGAGALEAYVPGIGAVAGPAGDVAGWYAGEVAQNLVSTATSFAQDITGIGGAVMGGMVPITTPQVTAPAPVMPVMGGGGGEIHFHVADMHEALHKARQIQAREARGLVGTRR